MTNASFVQRPYINWDLFIGKLFYMLHRTKNQLYDEEKWFSLGLIFQSRRRHTGRPEPEHIFSRPDGKTNLPKSKLFHLAITPERYTQTQP